MRRAFGTAASDHSDDAIEYEFGRSARRMSLCEAIVSILPVLFVLIVVAFLTLVYVYHVALAWSQEPTKRKVEIAWFCVIFLLFSVSYVRAALTDSGNIPDADEWVYGVEANDFKQQFEAKRTGERRYCKWCDKYKPDRGHHCRVCKKCVLKMDHHCPWLHNCVGFRNHKYFLLLIFYGAWLSFFVTFSLLPRAMDISRGKEDSDARIVLFISGMSLAFVLDVALLLFLLFHTWILLNGMTTIEFCEKSSKKSFRSQYNLGFWNNMARNLGPHWWLWFLPCSPPMGDGCHFEVDSESVAIASKQWSTGA